MNIFKNSFAKLKGHFAKATLLMLLPTALTAVLMLIGPITEYFSLLFFPLIIPFYYNAFKFVWDVCNNNFSYDKKYFSYGTYMKNLGVRGCFGVLPPLLYAMLFYSAFLTLFSSTTLIPLIRIFSTEEFVSQFTEQLNLYNNSNDLTGFIEFLNANGEELTGALTIIVNLSLFIALIIFVVIFNKPRLNYVLIQKVLPDADKNILGSQGRQMGRALLAPYFSKYLSYTFLPNLLLWGTNLLIFIGTSIGFSFAKNQAYYLTAGLPGVIFTLLSTPILVINGAMDISLADEFIPMIFNSLTEGEKNMFIASFYSPNYRHSKENEGKTPFNNLATKINAKVDESDVYDVNNYEEDINEETINKENNSEEKVNENKENNTYGVFDFSNKDDGENKDNEK